MSGHTPGPWAAVSSPLAPDFYSIEQVGADGERVDDIAFMTLHAGDVLRANARLISAAPDLLEALQKIDAMLVYSMDHAGSSLERKRAMSKCSDMARAAIAKAKGDKP